MEVFWDTSAIVPLLLTEPHSAAAVGIWRRTTQAWAWRWLQVETEAALGRRQAQPTTWAQWRAMALHIRWLEMDPGVWPQLCAFNRPLRLRAADAGHLFVFDRAVSVVPSLSFVTFDKELVQAAATLSLPVLQS